MVSSTNSITKKIFPHLHLLVSGGNSQVILITKTFNDLKIIGQTLDDAAGETFDKIGRMLGLTYPAGVKLAKIAALDETNYLNFPVSMKNSLNYNFSFSGLKTHVRYLIQKNDILTFEQPLTTSEFDLLVSSSLDQLKISNEKLFLIKQICVSSQAAIIQQLINKIEQAIKELKPTSIGLSGGVSANLLLRKKMEYLATKYTENLLFKPHISLTGDNAIMIGLAGVSRSLQ